MAFGAAVYRWGKNFDWAALAFAWLMVCAIGMAIYFLPIARLFDIVAANYEQPSKLAK